MNEHMELNANICRDEREYQTDEKSFYLFTNDTELEVIYILVQTKIESQVNRHDIEESISTLISDCQYTYAKALYQKVVELPPLKNGLKELSIAVFYKKSRFMIVIGRALSSTISIKPNLDLSFEQLVKQNENSHLEVSQQLIKITPNTEVTICLDINQSFGDKNTEEDGRLALNKEKALEVDEDIDLERHRVISKTLKSVFSRQRICLHLSFSNQSLKGKPKPVISTLDRLSPHKTIKPTPLWAQPPQATIEPLPDEIGSVLTSENLIVDISNSTQFTDVIGLTLENFTNINHLFIENLLFEILLNSQSGIQIYLLNHSLWITCHNSDVLAFKAHNILGVSTVYRFDNDLLAILISANCYTRLNQKELFILKKRLALGLNETQYQAHLKRAREKDTLAQTDKINAMNEMLHSISHQWRQPLNEIYLRDQILGVKYKESKEISQHIEQNSQSITKISAILNDVSQLMSIETTCTDLSIRDEIDSILLNLNDILELYKIEVVKSEGDIGVHAPREDCKKVLFHLIENSAQALSRQMMENRKISIEFTSSALSIKDNAGGIDDNIINRIFDPYFTSSTTGKHKGIGLYIASMLSKRSLNAELHASNYQTDKETGAEFTLNFH